MAKVDLAWPVNGISGLFDGAVYVKIGKVMVDGQTIIDAETYMRTRGVRTAPLSVSQENLTLAFQITISKWNVLKLDSAALLTWQVKADQLEKSLGRYTTSHQVFMSFYLTSYVSTLGVEVTPADLSAGTTLNYVDRHSRIWS